MTCPDVFGARLKVFHGIVPCVALFSCIALRNEWQMHFIPPSAAGLIRYNIIQQLRRHADAAINISLKPFTAGVIFFLLLLQLLNIFIAEQRFHLSNCNLV